MENSVCSVLSQETDKINSENKEYINCLNKNDIDYLLQFGEIPSINEIDWDIYIDSLPVSHKKKKYFKLLVKPYLKPSPIWLNTDDINRILEPYEYIKSSFSYMGCFPCNIFKFINFNKEFKKKKYRHKKQFAFVLNTDKNNQSGSHWISIMIDCNKKIIQYFDSTGDKPNKCLKILLHILKNIPLFFKFKVLINTKIHQKEDSECGIYAIYFIISCFYNKSFQQIVNNIKNDSFMKKYRYYLFRNK
jgi:hypothetical protein